MQSKTVIYSSILMLATTSLNGNATPLKPPAAAKYVAEPIIESQPVLSVEQDGEYRYPLFASDSDRDRLTWRFKDSNNQPSWLSLRPNAKVLTVAGNGETGSTDNSEPLNATYSTLWGIATDANGNVFTSEYYSYRIRQIALGHGAVSTVAGTGAQGTDDNNDPLSATFRNIRHLAHHNGILYITGNSSNKIRKIDLTNAVVTTLAGSGIAGNNDNPNPLLAQFDQPYGITVDPNGDIYISAGNLIRKIDGQTQAVTTYAGNGNSEHLDNPDPLKAGFRGFVPIPSK